jgi:hypothetical protein
MPKVSEEGDETIWLILGNVKNWPKKSVASA